MCITIGQVKGTAEVLAETLVKVLDMASIIKVSPPLELTSSNLRNGRPKVELMWYHHAVGAALAGKGLRATLLCLAGP